MAKKGVKYGKYIIFPYGKELIDEDTLHSRWMARAEIVHLNDDEQLLESLYWSAPQYKFFDTEQEAKTYAEIAAKKHIDAGMT